jgi:hypothetical protein
MYPVTLEAGELLEAVKPEGHQQICHDVHPDLRIELDAQGT